MIEEKLSNYSVEIQEMYALLRDMVIKTAPTAEETLWADLPSYYVGKAFVRLIPFKDHINVEAAALLNYKTQFGGYKFTPKDMLQIYVGQTVPTLLSVVFSETLLS